MYLGIYFIALKLAEFLYSPFYIYKESADRVVRYLLLTKHFAIVLIAKPSSRTVFIVSSGTRFTDDFNVKRSLQGCSIELFINLIH